MTHEIVVAVAAFFYLIMTVTLVGNLWYLRRRQRPLPKQSTLVSVLIPARNEASNLRRLLPALSSQTGVRIEVVVYDDDSSDRTWDVIQEHSGGRIRGIKGGPLPQGWIGKCHALHRAAEEAKGDLLVFLDADVLLRTETVIARLTAEFEALPPFSALTILPGLEPSGGRLLVSLVPNSILIAIPWFFTRHVRVPSMGALNGQCWMIDAEDYRALKPHEMRKDEILEDVQIGRDLVRAGMRLHLVSTRDELDVRMYNSLEEAWRGFRKNAYLLHGGTPLNFLLLQIPFVLLFLVIPLMEPVFLAWLYVLKWGSDRAAGFKLVTTVFTPVSYVLGLAMDWDSAWHHWRGSVTWKGRTIARPGAG